MAFKVQSSMVVGTFSDRRIFLVRDGFRASWSFSIRWRLSDGVSDEYPALAIRSLNSMITSLAVLFPCFSIFNWCAASRIWLAGLKYMFRYSINLLIVGN